MPVLHGLTMVNGCQSFRKQLAGPQTSHSIMVREMGSELVVGRFYLSFPLSLIHMHSSDLPSPTRSLRMKFSGFGIRMSRFGVEVSWRLA